MALRSVDHPDYYKMILIPGIRPAYWRPDVYRWGKLHMIEFLTRLTRAWVATKPLQLKLRSFTEPPGTFMAIPLGDISKEGGGAFGGHNSHQKGVDVDLYTIAKNGQQAPRIHYQHANYDLDRNILLARLIFEAGGNDIELVYFNDKRVVNAVKDVGKLTWWENHNEHFHIRLHARKP